MFENIRLKNIEKAILNGDPATVEKHFWKLHRMESPGSFLLLKKIALSDADERIRELAAGHMGLLVNVAYEDYGDFFGMSAGRRPFMSYFTALDHLCQVLLSEAKRKHHSPLVLRTLVGEVNSACQMFSIENFRSDNARSLPVQARLVIMGLVGLPSETGVHKHSDSGVRAACANFLAKVMPPTEQSFRQIAGLLEGERDEGLRKALYDAMKNMPMFNRIAADDGAAAFNAFMRAFDAKNKLAADVHLGKVADELRKRWSSTKKPES